MKQQSPNIELLLTPAIPQHPQVVWWPAADVYRCEHGWVVKFELAGVQEEDLQVAISGSNLRVSGTRRDWRIHDQRETHMMEIAYSHFERSVELPEAFSKAELRTEYRDGMLLVHVLSSEDLSDDRGGRERRR